MLYKKKLLALPVHIGPKGRLPAEEKNQRFDYCYDASVTDGILHLTLFDWEDHQARWRVFCDGEHWINYDLERKEWGKALMDNIGRPRDQMYWRNTYAPVSNRAEQAGESILAELLRDRDNSTADLLRRLQNQQKRTRSDNAAARDMEEMGRIFSHWPDLPKGWEKRMEDGPWGHSKYCFFHKRRKDDLSQLDALLKREFPGMSPPYVGECSTCSKTFGLPEAPEHDPYTQGGRPGGAGEITCPHCGAKLHPKKAGLGRKNLFEGNYRALATERDGVIYVDVVWASRNYTRAPYETHWVSCWRYWLDTKNNEARMWKNRCVLGWVKSKTVHEPSTITYTSDRSVLNTCLKTRLKYSVDRLVKTAAPLKTMACLTQFPCLEILDKMGLSSLTDDLIWDEPYIRTAVNFRGQSVKGVLGLTKPQLNYIRACRSMQDGFKLTVYKLLCREGKKFSLETEKLLSRIPYDDRKDFLALCRQMTAGGVMTYLSKQLKRHKGRTVHDVLIFWRDYLEECRILDYDLTDPYNRMPPDIEKAHQKTMALVSKRKNAAKDGKIAKRLEVLEKKYCFQRDGLLIRPAASAGELVQEGAMLHHCVATYIDRYAKGETDILLIRKAERPETPFVTAEYQGGKRRQAYGDYDKQPPQAVLDFLEQFEKWLNSKAKRKETAA